MSNFFFLVYANYKNEFSNFASGPVEGVRPDSVKCFHCGQSISQWEREDDPLEEHQKFSPNCTFVNDKMRERRTSQTTRMTNGHHIASTSRSQNSGQVGKLLHSLGFQI